MRMRVAIVAGMLAAAGPAAAADRITVTVDNAEAVSAYFRKIGFVDLLDHPERLQSVPRTRISRIPEELSDAWRENVSLRKSVFFRLGLSAVLQANEGLLEQRGRLESLKPGALSEADRAWVSGMMVRYRVAKEGAPPTAKRLAALLHRVDILPPSLVMAQGAIESAWVQSRFARKGQALFGQWTTSADGIKATGSDVRLARFDTPRDSLIAYMLNVNSHAAYRGLWDARATMRRNGETIDGNALAAFMNKYAETGETYVKLIRSIIRRSNLTLADTAKLGPGPLIYFSRGAPK